MHTLDCFHFQFCYVIIGLYILCFFYIFFLQHIDISFYYLRKKALSHTCYPSFRKCTTTSCVFDHYMTLISCDEAHLRKMISDVKNNDQHKRIKHPCPKMKAIIDFILGKILKFGKSWFEVDFVFMPFLIPQGRGIYLDHWSLGVLHIDKKIIYIYDSFNSPNNEDVETHVKKYCRILPFILDYLGFHEKRKHYAPMCEDFRFSWVETPFQNNT